MITKRNNSEKQIINVGNYSIAIIKEKVRSRFSSKTFVYKYSIKGNYYENEDGMNDILSKKYKAGDTIIIKFLPDKPENSIIIEDREYRSCYGIPPHEGWGELPACK